MSKNMEVVEKLFKNAYKYFYDACSNAVPHKKLFI